MNKPSVFVLLFRHDFIGLLFLQSAGQSARAGTGKWTFPSLFPPFPCPRNRGKEGVGGEYAKKREGGGEGRRGWLSNFPHQYSRKLGGREGGEANRRRAPRRRLCPPLLAEGGFSSSNLNTHIRTKKVHKNQQKGKGKSMS